MHVNAEASESESDRKNGAHQSSATHWFAMRASLESRVAMVCRVSAVRYALIAFSRGADRSPGTGSPYLPRRGGWWDKHKRLTFGSKQPQELCVRVCASARPEKCGRGEATFAIGVAHVPNANSLESHPQGLQCARGVPNALDLHRPTHNHRSTHAHEHRCDERTDKGVGRDRGI